MAAARAPGLDAVDWARRMTESGAGEILLTSMDRDGTKSGFDLALTRAVSDAVPVPVVASGGVGTLDHLVDGVMQGRRLGGARRLDLPFRRVHHRPGQGTSRPRRRSGPTNLARARDFGVKSPQRPSRGARSRSPVPRATEYPLDGQEEESQEEGAEEARRTASTAPTSTCSTGCMS